MTSTVISFLLGIASAAFLDIEGAAGLRRGGLFAPRPMMVRSNANSKGSSENDKEKEEDVYSGQAIKYYFAVESTE